MKNYCRYCGHCIDPGINEYYCTEHEKFLAAATITSTTSCRDYGYCGVDVITGKDHKLRRSLRRKPRKDIDARQILLRDWLKEHEEI